MQRGLIAALLGVSLLQGCATPGAGTAAKPSATATATPAQPVAKPVARPVVPAPAPERTEPVTEPTASSPQQSLASGIEAYNKGDYNLAIRRLTGPDIGSLDRAGQLSALKHSAFSYCVTKRTTQCRQQFNKAFKLDANFDLAVGEKGHPLWTPVFDASKKANQPKK